MKAFWGIWITVFWSFASGKPHIITILIDDLGWQDVGYHGNDQIKTPNIDALAYSGMILNRHYVLPTCSPSRTALLTGTYPIRTGMQGIPLTGGENRNLPLSYKLTPSYLKDLGYRTHMIGKWHLGFQTYNHVPNHRGFDTFLGYYNGYVDYYTYCYKGKMEDGKSAGHFCGYDMHYNDDVYRTNEMVYATKLFTEKARDVIRNHNESEPLYLYLSHLATHTGSNEVGIQAPEYIDVNRTYAHIKDYGRRLFAGCLEDLDRSVGVVVEELQTKGMLENSIILVMSDNGAPSVSADMAPNWSSNWPLAGGKFTLYEGGVRGAALIWSPLLPKGFINDNFMHISDWLPTFYSAAGGEVSNLGAIDGKDQWEALQNLKTAERDHILININERIKSESIILYNRWKLVKGGFPSYGYYELHWGEDENISPNPLYDLDGIKTSSAGKAVRSLPGYEILFEPKRMNMLRSKATVLCNPPKAPVPVQRRVPEKSQHRCPNLCIFDLVEDPCELREVKNEEILRLGEWYLQEYRHKLVPQKKSKVDPESNPVNFGGVWMPWDVAGCAKSKAMQFASRFVPVSIFLTCSWYSLRK